jgi:hypothetical protein
MGSSPGMETFLRGRPRKIAKIQRSRLFKMQAFAMPGKNRADASLWMLYLRSKSGIPLCIVFIPADHFRQFYV